MSLSYSAPSDKVQITRAGGPCVFTFKVDHNIRWKRLMCLIWKRVLFFTVEDQLRLFATCFCIVSILLPLYFYFIVLPKSRLAAHFSHWSQLRPLWFCFSGGENLILWYQGALYTFAILLTLREISILLASIELKDLLVINMTASTSTKLHIHLACARQVYVKHLKLAIFGVTYSPERWMHLPCFKLKRIYLAICFCTLFSEHFICYIFASQKWKLFSQWKFVWISRCMNNLYCVICKN